MTQTADNLLYDLSAEQSVLGAILIHNDRIDDVRDVGLKAEDFHLERHRTLFETMWELRGRRDPIDLITLSSHLRTAGTFEQIGGLPALTQLLEDSFSSGNVAHYARIVMDRALLRRLSRICTDISGRIQSGITDLESFLNQVEEDVFAVTDRSARESFSDMSSILVEAMNEIETRATRKSDIIGIPTGFTDFDRITGGLQPSHMVVIAARPGMGKTAFIQSLILNAAINHRAVIGLFSLEMSKLELALRFVAGVARIPSGRLKTGQLNNQEWPQLTRGVDQLARAKIFIDQSGGLNVMDIRSRSRRLKQQQKRLDLVVIDYLQLMNASRRMMGAGVNEVQVITEISKQLKELAKELNVPIVVLSQLNRGGTDGGHSKDRRPTLTQLRGSGSIEQDADIVVLLHREDYYDRESENRGIAEAIVAKNRHGEQDTVYLAWLGQYTLFANLEPEQRRQLPIKSGPSRDPSV